MSNSIQDVKARHLKQLMATEGVVSVGIGQDADRNPVIVIGMDRERPNAAETMPKDLEGYAVRIEIVGQIRAR